MNREYLGDALDFWKGDIIRQISDDLNDLHVVPMLTETNNWHDDKETKLYASLLSIQPQNIQCILKTGQNDKYTKKRMKAYWDAIPDGYDLFLDPDTGISLNSGSKKHVTVTGISTLLQRTRKRILLIYQHAWHTPNSVRHISEHLAKPNILPGVYNFACKAKYVSMFFLSCDINRLEKVRSNLSGFYLCRNDRITSIKP